MGLMLLGCGICTVFLLLQPSVIVGVFLLSGGRMFVEASYAALWTYTPEAYPTTVHIRFLHHLGTRAKTHYPDSRDRTWSGERLVEDCEYCHTVCASHRFNLLQ
jgi:hypothetical protein